MPETDPRAEARGLIRFIDASPAPRFACLEAARLLADAGFERLEESSVWSGANLAYVVRAGTLVAWCAPRGWRPGQGLRILAAHTDSPNLRLRPQPERSSEGLSQLGVEVYGSPLANSWLDRDLGLSGAVFLAGEGVRTIRVDRPLLRIPQLAPHLHPELRAEGLLLNRQTQLTPLWALDCDSVPSLRQFLAEELAVDPEEVASFDLMLHDLSPSRLVGLREEFLSAPRLDDLACAYVSTRALIQRAASEPGSGRASVVLLMDHEEIGSGSVRGARSQFLGAVLERLSLAQGGGREEYLRGLSDSLCVSADMAHAVNPNYPERSEPQHPVRLNGGPVVKVNVTQRYATEGSGAATFVAAAKRAGVPVQWFASRGDGPCGTTIGPLLAQQLGVETVDVGMPQLAMHSVRELGGADDPGLMLRALGEILSS